MENSGIVTMGGRRLLLYKYLPGWRLDQVIRNVGQLNAIN